jgi:RNA polymerase sigma-70 factor (ECF subfamily)
LNLPRPDATDEALMIRFQGGEEQAFVLLVRRHKGPLYHFALRHLRSAPQAEDIVQEAFARVATRAAEFKHEARFSTWLYAITRNLCIDQGRRNAYRRHPSLDQPRAGRDGEAGPTLGESMAGRPDDVERAATDRELQRRITDAVDALPEDQREVFLLREVANLPFKEIAVITAVPENTVKSRMRYALERLQRALSEYEEYARSLR